MERDVSGMCMETLFALHRVFRVTPNGLLLPETPGPETGNDREMAMDIVRAHLRSL